jgi:hypothetical protein
VYVIDPEDGENKVYETFFFCCLDEGDHSRRFIVMLLIILYGREISTLIVRKKETYSEDGNTIFLRNVSIIYQTAWFHNPEGYIVTRLGVLEKSGLRGRRDK